MLTDAELQRYSRQLLLPGIGNRGQKRLRDSHVLIIGAGGLGSPAALYLAGAGIGCLSIVDADHVELSNLPRQMLHSTLELGWAKADSAEQRLRLLNPEIEIIAHNMRFSAATALPLLAQCDFVIDAVDNFAGKFLIADACHLAAKPYCHAGVRQFHGQLLTVIPGQTTCYRCIFDAPPPPEAVPTCSEAGVFGPAAGVVGTLQAAEAVKYLLNLEKPLTNTLLTIDLLRMQFRQVAFQPNRRCQLCGDNPSITELQAEPQAETCAGGGCSSGGGSCCAQCDSSASSGA